MNELLIQSGDWIWLRMDAILAVAYLLAARTAKPGRKLTAWCCFAFAGAMFSITAVYFEYIQGITKEYYLDNPVPYMLQYRFIMLLIAFLWVLSIQYIGSLQCLIAVASMMGLQALMAFVWWYNDGYVSDFTNAYSIFATVFHLAIITSAWTWKRGDADRDTGDIDIVGYVRARIRSIFNRSEKGQT